MENELEMFFVQSYHVVTFLAYKYTNSIYSIKFKCYKLVIELNLAWNIKSLLLKYIIETNSRAHDVYAWQGKWDKICAG